MEAQPTVHTAVGRLQYLQYIILAFCGQVAHGF